MRKPLMETSGAFFSTFTPVSFSLSDLVGRFWKIELARIS